MPNPEDFQIFIRPVAFTCITQWLNLNTSKAPLDEYYLLGFFNGVIL